MSINKHTVWHAVRSLSTGLFVIGLIPFPFAFMGASNTSAIGAYFLFLLVSLAGIIISQIMVIKYKAYADTTDTKKKRENIYGIIGISLILLFVLSIVLLPYIGSLLR